MPESPELTRIGRYDITRVLGEGAMGVVYEGTDTRLHRKVAIKTILKSALDSDAAKEYSMRFGREAEAVARLNHPNIVQVFDFAEEGDVAYIVMEFVKGRELKSFFDAKERFEPKEVVHIMGELCEALHFAHEAGIIHRDIKPANVMIDSQGRVKLTDFGVARITDADRTVAERTQAGTVVGTPAYMSPEQISGGNLDRRTDVFSAGVILYEFLTGTKPFAGSGAWTIAKKILQDDPPMPSSLNQTVSPFFDAVVANALAKSADARYQTAREFGVALKRALEGMPDIAEVEKTLTQAPRFAAMPAPGAAAGDATVVRTIPLAPAAPAAKATGAQAVELEFWRSIKDGNDANDFDLYVEQFPNGIYAALARRRSTKLRGLAPEETDGKAKLTQEQERKEIEEAARREADAKAKLAEEKAELEAKLAKREEEFLQREAEGQAKLAAEKARQEAELAKREAELRKRESASPRKSPLAPVLIGIAVAALGGGLWYAFKPPDPLEERVAELTRLLEDSKKREAELRQSRQREAELVKEVEQARQREAEARKAGDVAKQREMAELLKQREAEAKKQADFTRQRESEAKKQAEAAEQRRAELAKLQADAAKKAAAPKRVEATKPAEAEAAGQAEAARQAEAGRLREAEQARQAEAARQARQAEAARQAKQAEVVKQAEAAKPPEAPSRPEAAKPAEPTKLAALTPTPSEAAPGAAEALLKRAVALEAEGKNAEAARLLRQATREGKGAVAGQAAKRLGDLLQRGVPGVSRDYAEALRYYQIARDNGVDPGAAKGR